MLRLKGRRMKALFCRSYDYHEWNDFVVASESEEKLKEYYRKIDTSLPLISADEEQEYQNNEDGHYIIKEIEVI